MKNASETDGDVFDTIIIKKNNDTASDEPVDESFADEDDTDEERIRSLWRWGKIVHIRKLRSFEEIPDKAHYMCREPRELGVYVPGEQMWTGSRGLIRPKFEYTSIDSDAVDISVPVGCTELSEPIQLPGYGGYKTIIYVENM